MRHQFRLTFLILSLLPTTLAFTAPPAVLPAPKPAVRPASTSPAAVSEISFINDFSAAQIIAQREGKPIVMVFGATWCGWCRRLESQTLAHQSVRENAADFVWAKIDIDDHPHIASAYQVRGVPHTVIASSNGDRLASDAGFLSAADFVALLQDGLQAFAAHPAENEPATLDLEQTVKKLLDGLSKPQRTGRRHTLDLIANLGPDAWSLLLERLEDQRLSVRAAAFLALQHTTGATLPFDPFAPNEQRQTQQIAWRNLIEAKRDTPTVFDQSESATVP